MRHLQIEASAGRALGGRTERRSRRRCALALRTIRLLVRCCARATKRASASFSLRWCNSNDRVRRRASARAARSAATFDLRCGGATRTTADVERVARRQLGGASAEFRVPLRSFERRGVLPGWRCAPGSSSAVRSPARRQCGRARGGREVGGAHLRRAGGRVRRASAVRTNARLELHGRVDTQLGGRCSEERAVAGVFGLRDSTSRLGDPSCSIRCTRLRRRSRRT